MVKWIGMFIARIKSAWWYPMTNRTHTERLDVALTTIKHIHRNQVEGLEQENSKRIDKFFSELREVRMQHVVDHRHFERNNYMLVVSIDVAVNEMLHRAAYNNSAFKREIISQLCRSIERELYTVDFLNAPQIEMAMPKHIGFPNEHDMP